MPAGWRVSWARLERALDAHLHGAGRGRAGPAGALLPARAARPHAAKNIPRARACAFTSTSRGAPLHGRHEGRDKLIGCATHTRSNQACPGAVASLNDGRGRTDLQAQHHCPAVDAHHLRAGRPGSRAAHQASRPKVPPAVTLLALCMPQPRAGTHRWDVHGAPGSRMRPLTMVQKGEEEAGCGTSTLPPSAIRYGRTSSSAFSTASGVIAAVVSAALPATGAAHLRQCLEHSRIMPNHRSGLRRVACPSAARLKQRWCTAASCPAFQCAQLFAEDARGALASAAPHTHPVGRR